MRWKCEKCGQKLPGGERSCPKCGTPYTYKCKDCGKELENGKYEYCPVCILKRKEKRNKRWKKIAQGVASGTIIITIAKTIARK